MSGAAPFRPLTGTRIVDLTQVLAGPYATYQLGLMGADVVKIEPPDGGDWTRAGGGDAGLSAAGMGLAYLTQNAGKRSVAIDIRREQGLDLLRRLVARADVLVENFRPGTAERLGLGWDDLRKINPRLVYCSISAFGQDGPIGPRGAYDHIVQGMCGIMHLTGTPETVPNKVGSPYVDYSTGMAAALAITAALGEVGQTGEGRHIDVAMLDTAFLLMASLVVEAQATGTTPAPAGNEAFSGSPSSGTYETADGPLMLAANNERQFQRLIAAIGRGHLGDDPRFAEPSRRKINASVLRRELADAFAGATAAEWEERLNDAGVPAVRVRTFAEALQEPQVSARGLLTPVAIGEREEGIDVPTLGFKVDGGVTRPMSPPPPLGADTAEILGELGYRRGDVAVLREAGIVGGPIV